MNLQTIANAAIILLLVGFIAFRQLQWRPVIVARMWRFPIIMGVIGLFLISTQTKGQTLTAFDIGVILIELVIAVGVGALMGRIAQFKKLDTGNAPQAAEFASRTGWVGMVLWIVMIGIRVGIDIWATQAGSKLAASTGIILIVLAVNRLSRTAVFAARVAKLDSAALSQQG
ncbi:MAG: hypothetical protein JWN80_1852 [Microbacteriaceae bacterium]|nr:hypothetical protein [Microbacteriaceae bacterium]